MNTFRFEAIDQMGLRRTGRLQADSREGALSQLRAAGLRMVSLTPAAEALPFWKRDLSGGDKPSRRDVMRFFQDFATLLEADLTVDKALRLSLRQASGRIRPVVQAMLQSVVAGRSLSDAMRAHPAVFAEDAVETVRAGEMTGMLSEVVARTADAMRRQQEMQSAIVSALIYPALLLVMALGIIGLVVTSLLPSIAPLFDAPGVVAPAPIRFMKAAETFLAENGLLLAGASVAIGLALLVWWRRPQARAWRNRNVRRLPLLGGMLNEIDVGRVCRILGTLVAANVPLLHALRATVDLPGGHLFRETLALSHRRIQEGARLSDALSPLGKAAPQMLDMIRTGEEVNRLADMLLRAADLAEENVRTRIDRLFTVLTPVITCVMGLVIGGLIMSIMSAVLSVNDLAATP